MGARQEDQEIELVASSFFLSFLLSMIPPGSRSVGPPHNCQLKKEGAHFCFFCTRQSSSSQRQLLHKVNRTRTLGQVDQESPLLYSPTSIMSNASLSWHHPVIFFCHTGTTLYNSLITLPFFVFPAVNIFFVSSFIPACKCSQNYKCRLSNPNCSHFSFACSVDPRSRFFLFFCFFLFVCSGILHTHLHSTISLANEPKRLPETTPGGSSSSLHQFKNMDTSSIREPALLVHNYHYKNNTTHCFTKKAIGSALVEQQ